MAATAPLKNVRHRTDGVNLFTIVYIFGVSMMLDRIVEWNLS